MSQLNRRTVLKSIACTTSVAAVSDSVARVAESAEPTAHGKNATGYGVPASLRAEHEELHEELVRLTKAGGKTGEAARAVAKALHPHFVKEEELAMPPLGLLRPLAAGQELPPAQIAKAVELTGKLKADLPAMLQEHAAIVGTLQNLAEAGKQENKPQAQQFADMLTQHAKTEEDVLYPAAILVGEYLKLKRNK